MKITPRIPGVYSYISILSHGPMGPLAHGVPWAPLGVPGRENIKNGRGRGCARAFVISRGPPGAHGSMGPMAHEPCGVRTEPRAEPCAASVPKHVPLYLPLYLGSKGPRVQGPPNGSKGILWEGPRSPPGIPWGTMGSNLGIPGGIPSFPPGIPGSPPGIPGVIFIHLRDPWGDLHTPQGSLG